ncbi:hypothetical protein AAG570_005316 [Ranatra chinensis]
MYRLDAKNETGGYSWLLISWSPDDSPIRQKMLYASTKATLKHEFGRGQIKEELHATTPEEVVLSGLMKQRSAAGTPAPLTPREEELSDLSAGLVSATCGSQLLGSVAIPLVEAAVRALQALKTDSQHNYVKLKIDIPAEQIVLDSSEMVPVAALGSKVPKDSARYHLFRFDYTHEGRPHQAIMFIYSMPGYSCPVKERMLYSASKGPFLETLEQKLSLKVDKKLEIESGEDLSYEYLYEELHPKTTLPRPRFEKPKGPPNRGAKRITKSQQ